MTAASVGLGSLKLSCQDPQLKLTLSSTAHLLLPPCMDHRSSAKEIAHLVGTGKLFVARAGTCRLGVLVTLNGDKVGLGSLDDPETQCLVESVAGCPVWSDLALELKRDTRLPVPPSQSASDMIFSVEHPASASGLLVPDQIPCAKFEDVSCHFAFQTKITKKPLQIARHSTGQRVLRSTKARNIEAESCPSRPFGNPNLKQKADILIRAALHALVGVKRRALGVRSVKASKCPSLIEMAPAVWNFHYFQAIAARSTFLPSIAGILVSLSNAQSPSLRQKAVALVAESDEAREEALIASSCVSEIQGTDQPFNSLDQSGPQRQLWEVLLRGVSPFIRTDRRSSKQGPKAIASQSSGDSMGREAVEEYSSMQLDAASSTPQSPNELDFFDGYLHPEYDGLEEPCQIHDSELFLQHESNEHFSEMLGVNDYMEQGSCLDVDWIQDGFDEEIPDLRDPTYVFSDAAYFDQLFTEEGNLELGSDQPVFPLVKASEEDLDTDYTGSPDLEPDDEGQSYLFDESIYGIEGAEYLDVASQELKADLQEGLEVSFEEFACHSGQVVMDEGSRPLFCEDEFYSQL